MFPAKASRHPSSWRFPGVCCAVKRRTILRLPRSCVRSIVSSTPTLKRTCLSAWLIWYSIIKPARSRAPEPVHSRKRGQWRVGHCQTVDRRLAQFRRRSAAERRHYGDCHSQNMKKTGPEPREEDKIPPPLTTEDKPAGVAADAEGTDDP